MLNQSESEEAPNRQEAMASNSINSSKFAILQDQVNSLNFYFTYLI